MTWRLSVTTQPPSGFSPAFALRLRSPPPLGVASRGAQDTRMMGLPSRCLPTVAAGLAKDIMAAQWALKQKATRESEEAKRVSKRQDASTKRQPRLEKACSL